MEHGCGKNILTRSSIQFSATQGIGLVKVGNTSLEAHGVATVTRTSITTEWYWMQNTKAIQTAGYNAPIYTKSSATCISCN